ncbi:MAG: hypothetical protein QOI05_357 [Bradyrhizobium sp.]|nr:hypothetical protein [Bradyrhizobium sp.]
MTDPKALRFGVSILYLAIKTQVIIEAGFTPNLAAGLTPRRFRSSLGASYRFPAGEPLADVKSKKPILTRADQLGVVGHLPPAYQAASLYLLAREAVGLMTREWFQLFVPAPDRVMSLLLLSVYSSFLAGRPLHKKAATREMGLSEIKSGRKYIALAEAHGFVKVIASPDDHRKELLYPSDRLMLAAEDELRQFSEEMHSFLLRTRSAAITGAPIDRGALELREMDLRQPIDWTTDLPNMRGKKHAAKRKQKAEGLDSKRKKPLA